MSDNTPKDSSVVTIGLVRLIAAVAFVVVAIMSQWLYLWVQVSQNHQEADENRQTIQKLQEKIDDVERRKLDANDFDKRHEDLQHRVDYLEELQKRGK